jgi:hypothetical protein
MLSIYPMMEALSPNLKKAAKIGAGVAGTVGAGVAAYKNKDEIGDYAKKSISAAKKAFSNKESSPKVKISTSDNDSTVNNAAKQSTSQAAENNKQGSKFKIGTEEKRLAARPDQHTPNVQDRPDTTAKVLKQEKDSAQSSSTSKRDRIDHYGRVIGGKIEDGIEKAKSTGKNIYNTIQSKAGTLGGRASQGN